MIPVERAAVRLRADELNRVGGVVVAGFGPFVGLGNSCVPEIRT